PRIPPTLLSNCHGGHLRPRLTKLYDLTIWLIYWMPVGWPGMYGTRHGQAGVTTSNSTRLPRSVHGLGFAGRRGRRPEFLPFPALLNTRSNILSTFVNCRCRSKARSICWAGTRVVISLSVSASG